MSLAGMNIEMARMVMGMAGTKSVLANDVAFSARDVHAEEAGSLSDPSGMFETI
jgi:hypothetical protein